MKRNINTAGQKAPRLIFIGLMMAGSVLSAFHLANIIKARNVANSEGVKARAVLADIPMTNFPQHSNIDLYQAYIELALQSNPLDLASLDIARQSAGEIIKREPHNLGAWNHLVFIDVARNKRLTREGIAALIKSYDVSPYGDIGDMIWRVDFATSYWASLPDSLRAKTMTQIPIIGRFGVSWPWRIQNCRGNPHPALQDAICAIAPGVDRTLPLDAPVHNQNKPDL